MNGTRNMRWWLSLLLVASLSGCVDLVSMNSAGYKRTANVDTSKYKLHGRVYTMRGLLGIFSTGMDTIAKRLDHDLGVPSASVPHSRNRDLSRFIIQARQANQLQAPIVLVGHSLGADDEIKVARSLNEAGVPVELLITLDPVNPGKIPPNVKQAVNIFKPHMLDHIPILRGVAVAAEDTARTTVENINLNKASVSFDPSDINHFNIDEDKEVQEMVIDIIEKTLKPIHAMAKHKARKQLSLFDRVGRLFQFV